MLSYNPLDQDRIVNNRELCPNAYLKIKSIKNCVLDEVSSYSEPQLNLPPMYFSFLTSIVRYFFDNEYIAK